MVCNNWEATLLLELHVYRAVRMRGEEEVEVRHWFHEKMVRGVVFYVVN